MNVRQLNKEQKTELKQNVLMYKNKNVSWEELTKADLLVSDAELEDMFEGVQFTEDDFFA